MTIACRLRLAVVTFLLLFLACAGARAAGPQEQPIQDITYCDLAKNPSAFSGKRIRIRAIYRYAFEVQLLESPVCCPGPQPKIWVQIETDLDDSSLKVFRKFPKGAGIVLVTLVGTLDTGEAYGDGGFRIRLRVSEIERLEAKSRSILRKDDPPWVPCNCRPEGTERK